MMKLLGVKFLYLTKYESQCDLTDERGKAIFLLC